MNNFSKCLSLLATVMLLYSCNTTERNENTTILIKTTLGDIKLKLYDLTPIHRDNFIKLINLGFYENISFHRVINNFMIQAGDPSTRAENTKTFPDSINTYTIPSEFNLSLFHKKGALAAARMSNEENPEMRSSGTQFYIVKGVKYTDTELDQAEQKINNNIKQALFNKIIKHITDSISSSGKTIPEAEIQDIASLTMYNYLSSNKAYKIPEDQRNEYKRSGGVPRLDATYTVFGEVTEGLDIVDKIACVITDNNDKPLQDIRILKIRIIRN